MLKKLCVLAAVAMFGCTVASAANLTSYEEIANVLASGKDVLVNINPEKCQTNGEHASRIKRLAIKFKDLFEIETSRAKAGKKMRAIAVQEAGLFGDTDTKFNWYRVLTLIMEDNSVMVFSDNVDPASFNLQSRVLMTCQLSADNSGGAVASVLK